MGCGRNRALGRAYGYSVTHEQRISRTSWLSIGMICLSLSLVVLILLPAKSSDGYSPINSLTAYSRQFFLNTFLHGVRSSQSGDFTVPATWNLALLGLCESEEQAASYKMLGIEDQTFGSIEVADILTGETSRERIRAVARESGTDDQSWEWVVGHWISRVPEDFTSGGADVVVCITRQSLESGRVIIAHTADGASHTFDDSNTRWLRERLEADERARERLNLAPLPPEFRTWLLTGEPASVGDGTFVPPKLNE